MNKKNIGIIAIVTVFLVIAGVGFNNMFSKSNEKNQISDISNSKVEKNIDDKNKLKTDLESETDEEDEESSEDKTKEETASKDDSKEVDTSKTSNETSSNDTSTNTNKDTDTNKDTNTNTNTTNNNSSTQTDSNKKPESTPQPEVPKKDTVTIAIDCKTAINNGVNNESGFSHLPSSGIILSTKTVEIEEGETVFDVLQKVVRSNNIHMEYTGSGGTIYIEGIHNLYEFDGGKDSGWMYSVNGWYPNYGAGVYELKANDVIKWSYTCDLGKDLGRGMN